MEVEDLEISVEANREAFCFLSESKDLPIVAENARLHTEIAKVFRERRELNSRILLNRQITLEFEERVLEIHKSVEKKHEVLNKITKTPIASPVNHRDYIVLTPGVLAFHNRIESIYSRFVKLARYLYQLQTLREVLISTSKNLWEECTKLHALLKNPNNRNSLFQDIECPHRDLSFEEDISSNSDDEIALPIPISHTNGVVPSLDLSKIHRNTQQVPVLNPSDSLLDKKCDDAKEKVQRLKEQYNMYTGLLEKMYRENSGLIIHNEQLCLEIGTINKQ